jgi:hypothetical protein
MHEHIIKNSNIDMQCVCERERERRVNYVKKERNKIGPEVKYNKCKIVCQSMMLIKCFSRHMYLGCFKSMSFHYKILNFHIK